MKRADDPKIVMRKVVRLYRGEKERKKEVDSKHLLLHPTEDR